MDLKSMIQVAVKLFNTYEKKDVNMLVMLVQQKCHALLEFLPNISNEMIEPYLKKAGIKDISKALIVLDILRLIYKQKNKD